MEKEHSIKIGEREWKKMVAWKEREGVSLKRQIRAMVEAREREARNARLKERD